jgi:vacuolar-type H+-ATPase subunit B/Vma2
MANNELDRLRSLVEIADQVSKYSETRDDARRHVNHLIAKAEQDIKMKTLEIQMQQAHIALLKQLEAFVERPPEAGTAEHIPLGEAGRPGSRGLAAERK